MLYIDCIFSNPETTCIQNDHDTRKFGTCRQDEFWFQSQNAYIYIKKNIYHMEWYHEIWYTIKWVDFHIPNPYNTTWFQLRPQEALALRPFCVEGHRTRTTKMAGDPIQKQGSKAKTPFWDIHSSVCVITPNWPYDISLAMGPYWSYFFC